MTKRELQKIKERCYMGLKCHPQKYHVEHSTVIHLENKIKVLYDEQSELVKVLEKSVGVIEHCAKNHWHPKGEPVEKDIQAGVSALFLTDFYLEEG